MAERKRDFACGDVKRAGSARRQRRIPALTTRRWRSSGGIRWSRSTLLAASRPARGTNLVFGTGGKVAQVLVEAGDAVGAGRRGARLTYESVRGEPSCRQKLSGHKDTGCTYSLVWMPTHGGRNGIPSTFAMLLTLRRGQPGRNVLQCV